MSLQDKIDTLQSEIELLKAALLDDRDRNDRVNAFQIELGAMFQATWAEIERIAPSDMKDACLANIVLDARDRRLNALAAREDVSQEEAARVADLRPLFRIFRDDE